MKPNARTVSRTNLTEFVPFGVIIVTAWILAGALLWTMGISELFVWYGGFYVSFLVVVELAFGSGRLVIPTHVEELATVGFFVWIAAFVGYVTGTL